MNLLLNLAASATLIGGLTFGGTCVIEKAEESFERSSLKQMLEQSSIERVIIDFKVQQLLSEPHELIEIELIEKTDKGVFFYDHSAEFEPRIFSEWELLEEFGVDDLEVGQTITGIFDEEGWELFGFKKSEDVQWKRN